MALPTYLARDWVAEAVEQKRRLKLAPVPELEPRPPGAELADLIADFVKLQGLILEDRMPWP